MSSLPRHWTTAISLIATAVWLLIASVTSADEHTADLPKPTSVTDPDQQNLAGLSADLATDREQDSKETELREILDIRHQVNSGGWPSPIFNVDTTRAEVSLDLWQSNDSEFVNALRQARRDIHQSVTTSQLPCDLRLQPEVDRRNHDLTIALLATSRQLDQEVHQLDKVGEFDKSDRLRELANRLRHEARRFVRP